MNNTDISKDKAPKEISIGDLFREDTYIVPIYQRNYAWKNDEIEQLLEDMRDAKEKYYLGSLIVNKRRDGQFEVIDGQQRLTTVFLLLAYLGHEGKCEKPRRSSLHFEAREKSDRTLKRVTEHKEIEMDEGLSEEIIAGYQIIKEWIERNKASREDFIEHALANVYLFRVQVPQKIDLNQYFEVMNTRGEQLELHEIVKARILEKIDPDDVKMASEIWDACAQMDKYIQMNFPRASRDELFGKDWNELVCDTYKKLKYYWAAFCSNDENDENTNHDSMGNTLKEILEGALDQSKAEDKREDDAEKECERFESIISFPHFLLQLHNIICGQEKEIEGSKESEERLDDKKLIETMEVHYKDKNAAEEFIISLLKYRFLFDQYIIKREYARDYKENGRWSLRRLNKTDEGKAEYKSSFGADTERVLMLQSCLRVTYTSPKTMDWIWRTLQGMNDKTCAKDLVDFGEQYCCEKIKNADIENSSGFGFQRIVFTYLDYLLWKNKGEEYKDFHFQFRTSIEHFSPQHPDNGEPWEENELNSFGNLALVSVRANSKFSNQPPESKAKYSEIIKTSPKLGEMCRKLEEEPKGWTAEKMKEHERTMMELLNEPDSKPIMGMPRKK